MQHSELVADKGIQHLTKHCSPFLPVNGGCLRNLTPNNKNYCHVCQKLSEIIGSSLGKRKNKKTCNYQIIISSKQAGPDWPSALPGRLLVGRQVLGHCGRGCTRHSGHMPWNFFLDQQGHTTGLVGPPDLLRPMIHRSPSP